MFVCVCVWASTYGSRMEFSIQCVGFGLFFCLFLYVGVCVL